MWEEQNQQGSNTPNIKGIQDGCCRIEFKSLSCAIFEENALCYIIA
jgi:hypothetical protein